MILQEMKQKLNVPRNTVLQLVNMGKILKEDNQYTIIDEEFFKDFSLEKHRQYIKNEKNKKISEKNKARHAALTKEEKIARNQKISERTKEAMKRSDVHERLCLANKENRQKISNSVKEHWKRMSKEDYAARCLAMSEGQQNMSKEAKEKAVNSMRVSLQLKYSDESYREQHSLRVKQSMTEDVCQKISERTKAALANQEIYEKVCLANKRNAELISIKLKALWTQEKRFTQSLKCQEAASLLFSNEIRKREILQKQYDTKKQNGTLWASKDEIEAKKLLLSYFSQNDISKDYNRDSRYPYKCDFYIHSLDLFIELNCHWTHGPEPFDKTNKHHIERLNKLKALVEQTNSKYYKAAIDVWTDRDTVKIACAKMNKLNYKIFYEYDEFESWCYTVFERRTNE